MDLHEPVATLTQCERALGGYAIKWRCESYFLWQCVAQQVRALPRGYWRYERSAGHIWWVAEAMMPQLATLFQNYGEAMSGADHRPETTYTRPPVHVLRAFAALHLQVDAPPAVIKAVYRALNRSAPAVTETRIQRERAYRICLSWAEEQTTPAAA